MAMLAMHNYIDRSSLTVTANPTALAELPTSNLKVPWFDGIARGSSADYVMSHSWEIPPFTFEEEGLVDPPNRVDLVAALAVNWRSSFLATLKWWNTGGSWESPVGVQYQLHYYVGDGAPPWIGSVPRNVFIPLPESVYARFWRLDVVLSNAGEGAAYPWESRRLWCGPALRFGMRRDSRTVWAGTHVVADSETGVPSVSSGRAFRRVTFGGRSLPVADVYGSNGYLHSLDQLLFNNGPFAEAILLPRTVANITPPNEVQTMGIYGRMLPGFETVLGIGNRVDIAGEIQEVPHPLPYPLAPPS